MAFSVVYLSSFGTAPTMTLHNGTTHVGRQLVLQPGRAVISYITLPTQEIYDLDATDQAPIVPADTIEAITILKMTTTAAVLAEIEAWDAHKGKKATLTATKVTSGTTTCTARLETFYFPENPKRITNRLVVASIFRPTTNWA